MQDNWKGSGKLSLLSKIKMEKPQRFYPTLQQKIRLRELVDCYPALKLGKFSSAFTRKDSQKLWSIITEQLNSMTGANKEWQGWRKTYQDMKQNVKKKHTLNRRAANVTGGGPPLTDSTDPCESMVSNDALNGFGVESVVVFEDITSSQNQGPKQEIDETAVEDEAIVVIEIADEEEEIVIEQTDGKENADDSKNDTAVPKTKRDRRTAPQQRLDEGLALASGLLQSKKMKIEETQKFRADVLNEFRVLNDTLKQLLEINKSK